jgi:hypothetical protein
MLTNPGASCVADAAPVQGRPVNGFIPCGEFTRPDGGAGETGTGGAWGKTRELMGLTALSPKLLAFCASEVVAAVRTKKAEPISLREVAIIVDLRFAPNLRSLDDYIPNRSQPLADLFAPAFYDSNW